MRKLNLLLMASAVASIGIAEAAPFQGFYLGAQAGYTQRTVSNHVVQDSSGGGAAAQPGFINATAKKKANGLVYGMMGGWGTNINNFYVGLEASIEDSNADKNREYNFTGSDNSGPWPYRAKYKRGPVLGLSPRIGAVVANSILLYGKLGVELSRDKVTHQNVGGNIASPPGGAATSYPSSEIFQSSTKTKMVFVPGLGIEKAVGNVMMRLEYNYNPGAKMQQNPNFVQGGYNCNEYQTVKYTAHVVKLGVSYQF